MQRGKILCALLNGLMFVSVAGAQNAQGVIVAENGLLLEKTVISGTLRQLPLSGSSTVMYNYGISSATGEILFGMELDNRLHLMITGMDNYERGVAPDVAWASWSPQGNEFIYYDAAGALYRQRGDERQLLTAGVAAASYSPNGNTLALVRTPELNPNAVDQTVGLWVMDLRNGEERLLTSRYNETLMIVGYNPVWLNDEQIFFISDGGDTPFWIANAINGETSPLMANRDLPRPATPFFVSSDRQIIFFGREQLDGPDQVVGLRPRRGAAEIVDQVLLVEGNPIGFTLDGQTFLMAAEGGILQVDLETFSVLKVADPPTDEFVTLGSALYRVKHNGPMQVSAWTPTSWFSHNNTPPFADGGPYRFDCVNFGRTGHRGVDQGTRGVLGVRIDASTNGTVDLVSGGCGFTDRCQTSSTTCGGGFGNYVRIRHSNGATSFYAHQRGFRAGLATGQSVTCNTQLGGVGSTGNSTGCHLHFEIRFVVGGATRSIDPYGGRCNWTTDSLWVEFNHPFHCR